MAHFRIVARDRIDRLGEGPLWSDRDGALYWVDILDARVNRLDLASDRVTGTALPETIGWVIERRDAPGFIAGLKSGFVELTLDPLAIAPIGDPEPDAPDNRLNDAKADPLGRIFAGTMPDGAADGIGALYRLDPDRSIRRVDSGYGIANGPAITADGRTMFHTDSRAGVVYRMEISPDGSLSARETFLRFPREWGSPDGMTIDAEGGLWVAHWGGSRISRFVIDGTLDRTIALPASQITSIAFAGAALDRMFVTSAADGVDDPAGGALFEIDAGVCGLPPCRFAG